MSKDKRIHMQAITNLKTHIIYSGAFVLLPKFAYDDEALKESYWIKQYSPEVLGVEDAGHAEATGNTKEDKLVREAIDRIKRIEENLGIPKQ